jgi:hypothetical protein
MKAVTLVLVAAGLLLGGRVLVGWTQREQCGAQPGLAFWLSVQALGATPSAVECLSLALTAPAPASPASPPPAATPEPTSPPTPAPEPPPAPDPLGDCEWIAANDNSGDGWWIAPTPAGQPTCDRLNEGRHPPARMERELRQEMHQAQEATP